MTFGLFQVPAMFSLLLFVALVTAAAATAARHRRSALRLLGLPENLRARIVPWAVIVALIFVVLALARPAWNPRPEPSFSQGRDVIFVLDVSKSMLARDRVPNRLESARIAIRDLVDKLRPEDRVALVVFAGSASIECPPTTDFGFFRQALDTAGPESVSFGGTRIGDALRKTVDKLFADKAREGYQDVILLTDGGDQNSDMEQAVAELNKAHAGLIVIGLGSDTVGARIPLPGEEGRFMVYQDQEVWTRQDSAQLEKLVQKAKNGLYLNASTRPIDLYDVYERFVEHSSQVAPEQSDLQRLEEKFPWFLGIGVLILLLCGETWNFPARRRAAALIALAFLAVVPVRAEVGDEDLVKAAKAAQEAPRFLAAAERYRQSAEQAADPRLRAVCFYDAGYCEVRAAESPFGEEGPAVKLNDAIRLFEQALALDPHFPEAARNLEIARYRLDSLEKQAAAEKKKEESQSGTKPSDPSQKGSEKQDKSGDQMDNQDDDSGDQTDHSSQSSDKTSTTAKIDLTGQNLAPPNVSPQELIRQEKITDEQRAPVGSGRPGPPVKEDW